MRPSAGEPAIRGNGWECLALREMAATEEGDAFLASMRPWDVVLLMEDGPYRTCFLGMRRPYGQAVP
jgi:hypothetical protein